VGVVLESPTGARRIVPQTLPDDSGPGTTEDPLGQPAQHIEDGVRRSRWFGVRHALTT
jgi:hypothetical protein